MSNTAAEDFANSLEEAINGAQQIPDRKLRVYCMGKDGEDFRVGQIQITPTGLAVISGQDNEGNSVYSISHFHRLHLVCEVSTKITNEDLERKPIGFSR